MMHLTAGPHHRLTPAASLGVLTRDQHETDRLWSALVDGGGAECMCGWLIDRPPDARKLPRLQGTGAILQRRKRPQPKDRPCACTHSAEPALSKRGYQVMTQAGALRAGTGEVAHPTGFEPPAGGGRQT